VIPASFHPAAEAELRDAAAFYDARAPGLGGAYLDEAQRTLDLIRQFPRIGPQLDDDIRRFAFGRFPFSLIYRLPGDYVRVLAVMHHRQRPGYWKDRQ
jgi:plasmid stabilization system protein ParE